MPSPVQPMRRLSDLLFLAPDLFWETVCDLNSAVDFVPLSRRYCSRCHEVIAAAELLYFRSTSRGVDRAAVKALVLDLLRWHSVSGRRDRLQQVIAGPRHWRLRTATAPGH